MEKYVEKIRMFTNSSKLKKIVNAEKTPLIVYDFDNVSKVIEVFRRAFADREYIKLFFAVKSNNNLSFLKFLSEFVDGFDTASIEEFNLVKKLRCNISFTSPGVSLDDIELLLSNRVIFDFDSISQIDNYTRRCSLYEIGIRINIADSCIGRSRFGILLNNTSISYFHDKNLKITSIHFHTEMKDERYTQKIIDSLEQLIHNKVINPLEVRYLNLGGGFLNMFIENKLNNIVEFIDELKMKYFSANDMIKFVIEPGATLSIFSAYLLTEVLNINDNNNEKFAVLNASAYNLIRWFKTTPVYYTSEKSVKYKYNIYGNTCYEYDIFFNNIWLNEIAIADRLILFPFGAYTRSNHANLHSMKLPTEAYYINDAIKYEN